MTPRTYYVYFLTNKRNTVLYVGMTNDLARRLQQHRTGAEAGFTARYRVGKLVHIETFTNVNEAIACEKRLKRWRRSWKVDLIRRHNPTLRDLWGDDVKPF